MKYNNLLCVGEKTPYLKMTTLLCVIVWYSQMLLSFNKLVILHIFHTLNHFIFKLEMLYPIGRILGLTQLFCLGFPKVFTLNLSLRLLISFKNKLHMNNPRCNTGGMYYVNTIQRVVPLQKLTSLIKKTNMLVGLSSLLKVLVVTGWCQILNS